MPDPKYLSQVEMPNGTLLEIKDTVARQMATGGARYIGKLYVDGTTYTHLTDGDQRTSVEIIDASTTGHHTVSTTGQGTNQLKQGDIVLDDGKEFIFDGTLWELMGADNLGQFAFVDEGRVTVPTVSYGNPTPNHTSTAATVNIAQNDSGNLAITGTFTQPSVSIPVTLTGTSTHGTSTKTMEVVTTTTIPSGKTATYKPAGTVSKPSITLTAAGGTYTIKNPTAKDMVKEVTASNPGSGTLAGEVVYAVYTENTETLSLKRLAAPTEVSITTSDVTVKTGDGTYGLQSAPTFTGTDVYQTVTDTFTDAAGTVSVSGTVSGTTTGGAYTPKKYQIGVNYDKTTSVTQGTKTDGTVTKVVTPYTGS